MSFILEGVLHRRDPVEPAAPIVFDSPHSGTVYPADFHYACPLLLLRRTEDTFVDRLFDAVPGCGGVLLAAQFPRCYIDANRAEDDIDPLLLAAPWPEAIRPSDKSALGLGLVRRLVRMGTPIYARPLHPAEIAARIERFHRPYHQHLHGVVESLAARFGAVWHVNCHSMPSSGVAGPGTDPGARPDFVLGDRDGTTCAPDFVRVVTRVLEEMGYRVALNDPYKGVELVRRHSDPARHRHSLQLEINRRLYMNEETLEPNQGFEPLRRDLGRLTAALCDYARQNAAGAGTGKS